MSAPVVDATTVHLAEQLLQASERQVEDQKARLEDATQRLKEAEQAVFWRRVELARAKLLLAAQVQHSRRRAGGFLGVVN